METIDTNKDFVSMDAGFDGYEVLVRLDDGHEAHVRLDDGFELNESKQAFPMDAN